MAMMLTRQICLRVIKLAQNSMNVEYLSSGLGSDLSDVLSEISEKCPNFNPQIIAKLDAAREWARVGQYKQSVANLSAAYQNLAKNYLLDTLNRKESSIEEYLLELIKISVGIESFGIRYQSFLEDGIDLVNDSRRNDLQEYCELMLNNKADTQQLFNSGDVNYEFVENHVKHIMKHISMPKASQNSSSTP